MKHTLEGWLEPGIQKASWNEVKKKFGFNSHRRKLLEGLEKALKILKKCGCKTIYLDGSFVNILRDIPGDYDVVWDWDGVDIDKLHDAEDIFFDFDNQRKDQKEKFKGEFFSSGIFADTSVQNYIDFFQYDTRTGVTKGILKISLGGVK